MNIMTPIMVTKLTISSEDDARQSSVKTEHNVGWQTYLSSRRDIIVAELQSRGKSLAALYSTVRSGPGLEFKDQNRKYSSLIDLFPDFPEVQINIY